MMQKEHWVRKIAWEKKYCGGWSCSSGVSKRDVTIDVIVEEMYMEMLTPIIIECWCLWKWIKKQFVSRSKEENQRKYVQQEELM